MKEFKKSILIAVISAAIAWTVAWLWSAEVNFRDGEEIAYYKVVLAVKGQYNQVFPFFFITNNPYKEGEGWIYLKEILKDEKGYSMSNAINEKRMIYLDKVLKNKNKGASNTIDKK